MPDHSQLNIGAGGDLIAADELATLNGGSALSGGLYPKAQIIKVGYGVDGDAQTVDMQHGFPVTGVGELIEVLETLRMTLQSLSRNIGQSYPDAAGRLRVLTDASSAIGTVSTVTGVTTVSTVTSVTTLANQTSMGGIAANHYIPAMMQLSANDLRRNISVT